MSLRPHLRETSEEHMADALALSSEIRTEKVSMEGTMDVEGHTLPYRVEGRLEEGRSVWELEVDDPQRVFIEALGGPIIEFYAQCGGENYVQMGVWSPEYGRLLLTVQREAGKTPHQLRREAEAERDTLAGRLKKAQAENRKLKAQLKGSIR